ncbi:MAG: sugar-binding protein [Bacteroidota bacterium]|nr:sugar-binding protein [Bacteroidota bacterium]
MRRLQCLLYAIIGTTVAAFSQPVIFNGFVLDKIVVGDPWPWGGSKFSIVTGGGIVVDGSPRNAIKWTQGSGWSGIGFTLTPTNLSAKWLTDTIQFKAKFAPEDPVVNDTIRMQLEGSGKKAKIFTPIHDNQWHTYKVALNNLYYADGTTHIDSTQITVFNIFAENTGLLGRVVYITDIWVGNPIIAVPALPVTIFNGIAFDGIVQGTPSAWSSNGFSIEKGAGTQANANAIKWVQGTGWCGWTADIISTNMSGSWPVDSLKLKIKAEAGVGALRVQIDAVGGGKVGKVFTPTADNTWHSYLFALKDLVYQDAATSIDSTKINKFELMAENSGIANKVVYVTDVWSGNPTIDVIPPVAPTGVDAIGGTYANVVLWNDVPGEPGSKYNVYYSDKKFTAIDSTIDDVPPYDVPLGTGTATHLLLAPQTDQNVTYYYGVAAKDAAGNVGPVAVTAASVTTKAQGVPVISPTAPANFAADGALTEWTASGIAPIRLNAFGANPTAHVASGGNLRDSLDLNVKVYLAMDADNLYIAYDVIDDTVYVSADTTEATWQQDSPDLNIGLYDWRGPHHAGYTRGATPDYMLRFSQNRLNDDHSGKILMYPGTNYVWKKKTLTSGYIVEAKIPFTTFAAISAGDNVFSPKIGMRIPIDFSINDRDGLSGRKAILSYSNQNNNSSYQNMYNWTYTWVGNKWTVGVQKEPAVAKTFELSQNYPNPFNPTTNIKFSIPQSGMVTLKVFDILGREVMTVLNQFQEAGSYTATLDASKLATGMYVYKLESGSFSSVKKMMLIK